MDLKSLATELSKLSCSTLLATAVALIIVTWVMMKLLLPKRKVGDFHKKYVLITGCDTGFGREAAIRLDQMGFNVLGACLTLEGKKSLEKTCSKRLVGLVMDVTKHEQILAAYEQVKRIIPPSTGLWALDNNAGYMTLAPTEWFTMDECKRMADVNLWGLIDVTKTFLPLLKKAKGRIVNISSIAGLFSGTNSAPYSVTKYGVEAFSDALRREMAPWGVRVSILEPQAFRTPLWSEIMRKMDAMWDRLSPELKEEYGEQFRDENKKNIDDYFNKQGSPHTHLYVDAVIDAFTSRDPKPRYHVGFGAIIIAIIASLPTTWTDAILRRMIKVAYPKGAQGK